MPLPKSPHPDDAMIGAAIRQARMLKGISQTALGEAVGVTFQQIQKYERGVNRISYSRLKAVATALETTAQVLVGETDPERNTLAGVIDPDILAVVVAMRAAPPETRATMRRVIAAIGA